MSVHLRVCVKSLVVNIRRKFWLFTVGEAANVLVNSPELVIP